MSFNEFNQYVGNHKAWDHVGNIIPAITHCEGRAPHAELKPAEWLPVVFYDKHYEVWFVVMPGKAVALDPDGRAMPAQYGLTSASVVYTQNDVDAGVIDVATGLPVTAAKTVVLANVDGTKDTNVVGWTRDNAGTGTGGSAVTSSFLGKWGVSFVDGTAKYPIGVAPYPYLQWAGGDGFNPANLRQHNHILQHQVVVLCDYVIKLPLVPAKATNEAVDKTLTASDLALNASNAYARAYIQNYARYDKTAGLYPVLDTMPVVAYSLSQGKLAKQTARTQLVLSSSNSADDVSDVLVNERSSVAAVRQAGDYWVDIDVGVVFIYSATGAALPTSISGAAGTVRLSYYHYNSNASTLSKFAQVLGDVQPGEFLKVGAEGNLVPISGSEDFKSIVGQVLKVDNNHPKSGLDKVRTAYSPALATNSAGSMANGVAGSGSLNLGQLDQMPGTATGGYNAQLSYAGAADTIVIVNLVSR